MGLNLAFNPLNAELNPICHLLALLGAHHIFHVSVLRVKDAQVEYKGISVTMARRVNTRIGWHGTSTDADAAKCRW